MQQLFLMPTDAQPLLPVVSVLECLSHHPDCADTASNTQGCDPSTPVLWSMGISCFLWRQKLRGSPWNSQLSLGPDFQAFMPWKSQTSVAGQLSLMLLVSFCQQCLSLAVVAGMGYTFPLTGRREPEVIGEFSRWERKDAAPPLKMQHGNLHVEILNSQVLVENTHFPQQAETCMEHHNSPV